MPSAPRIFISYAHEDESWKERLVRQLTVLELEGELEVWDDRQIEAGEGWLPAIEDAMKSARVAVLLISAHFLTSDFIRRTEVPFLLKRREREGLPVLPLIVGHCLWERVPWLAALQCRPKGGSLLQALSESDAEAALVAFADEIATMLDGTSAATPLPSVKAQVSIARLPFTGETFVAREAELAHLDEAWEDGTNVISFVAMGGTGKSALINQWLVRMQDDGWRGAEQVLGWSFYSQGADFAGASSEAFSEYALDWLGYTGEVIDSPWRKGEVLARFLRNRRTLLILDGLEPLQHPPGSQTGRIKDPTIQAMVRELAADNPGLCVITTRLEVADIAGRAGAESRGLDKLPPEAGAELLRLFGVKGSETELRAAAEERGGNGLALTLLGTYLRDTYNGDIRRRNEITVLDDATEVSDHARHVMEAYEKWFGPGPELQILHLLGLFDRPAEPMALAALRAEPEIPGLTEGISTGNETAWQAALSRLRKASLVAPAEELTTPHSRPLDGSPLDTHPLVREHFGERLRQMNPEALRAANQRLYEHYRNAAPEFPDTLDEMLPLYAAVIHGCRAGKEQEVFDEVYQRRILRGDEHLGWKKLGAIGAELTALSAFFDNLWDRPSHRLRWDDQAFLLNTTGYHLFALGRALEALQPMRAGLDARIHQQNWRAAAIVASNLTELTLSLGDIRAAMATARESVDLADRSGDGFWQRINRAAFANTLHQWGGRQESEAWFREAEAMQVEQPTRLRYLSSLSGYWYCELLLSRAEPHNGSGLEGSGEVYRQACQKVWERAEYTLEIAARNDWLLDIGLGHLILGRALLGLAWTATDRPRNLGLATEALDKAVDGLREAGTEHHLPRSLLARATLRRLASDREGAAADLWEAQEIAERGSMRLHEADAHLEWTRLHLATGDPATAREHLDRARELVRACGYGRREREVTWLEGRLAALDEAESA